MTNLWNILLKCSPLNFIWWVRIILVWLYPTITLALEYYIKSLSIELNTFGQNHPDVATSFNNIAFVYKAKGDYNKALEYFTKWLSVKLITLGVDHPEVANAYSKIGKVYMATGGVDRAIEYQFYSMNPAIGSLESRIGRDSGTDDSDCDTNSDTTWFWFPIPRAPYFHL